ncbi:MAG: hypothetical protein ACN4GW_10035 [Desulforhopalus sp.]
MERKITAVITVLLLVGMMSVAQAATTLTQIGRSPFHQPPLTSVDDLHSMVQDKQGEVEKGFSLAGRSDLYKPFMEQLPQAQIDSVEFHKGSTFEWMFYKKKGKGAVRVVKDVTWGSDTPFPGFKFDVDKDGNRYTFAIPNGCGNIALIGMSKIPAVAAAPAPITPPANQPPTCGAVVTPVEAFCGGATTVDASSSTDSDGTITRMSIAVVDAQGQVVSEQVVDGGGLVADIAMPCGPNTVKVTVTDNDGQSSTSAECTVNVSGSSRTRFIADLGYYRQFDPGNYLFGRVGLEYKINEDFSILGMVGGAPQISGTDGESAFIADLLGEYSFSRYFVDFGVGAWLTDGDDDNDAEDSQLDLIAAFGARIYGEPEDFNASLFVEVRSGIDELDKLYEYGRFGFGVRFRF